MLSTIGPASTLLPCAETLGSTLPKEHADGGVAAEPWCSLPRQPVAILLFRKWRARRRREASTLVINSIGDRKDVYR
jgi:hypothetical protein